MRKILFLTLATVAFSCGKADRESIYRDSSFDSLLELHCAARKLKNKRFDLAEKFRKDTISSLRGDSERRELASQSRALADSIRGKIKVLTSELTTDEKRTFNDSIEQRIAKMGCE